MTKCEREGCRMPCKRMPPCAKSEARLRKWLRRWLATAPISLGLNLATKRLRSEIDAALNGVTPPKRRAK